MTRNWKVTLSNTVSIQITPENPRRGGLIICNCETPTAVNPKKVWVTYSQAAVREEGRLIFPGGSSTSGLMTDEKNTDAVFAIAQVNGTILSVQEWDIPDDTKPKDFY